MPRNAPVKKALTQLDHRIEAAVGHSIERLWQHRDRGLLDEQHAHLVDEHRLLVQAETNVTFYRSQLNSLSSGQYPVDGALFERIERTVDLLEDAARTRDQRQAKTVAALEPVEAAVRDSAPRDVPNLPAPDIAALLAITQGAKLHQNLLTQQLYVVTASGTRIPYSQLQRLEEDHLVVRDTSHPVTAGQPVTLTDTGRAALTAPRSPKAPGTAPVPRPGTWPAATPARR
ncbi:MULTISPECIES: hypothetical protein [unclassified Streptomyces]|uniref:hypothetical protein n=1 Tax=unclassified Streptomyces TaxID=2593676 RepID=UPI00082387ED|nr:MULTISPECIES: hypothetical protein [unclassified Streptomyces]MYT96592.1 hypothetical protein [Streptomyces sp. SID8350]SCK54078.1 hypothetical protein YUWDRAFT_04797 [Streptomyces sp. AmelKG-D3]